MPLFTALLNYRGGGHSSKEPVRGINLLTCEGRTSYPLSLSVDDLGEGFNITAQVEQPVDPRRILGYVSTAARSLIDALEDAPLTAALALSVLPETERQELIVSFNRTRAEYPSDEPIHEIFEKQALKAPNSIAVRSEGISLTYEELNRRANQLSIHLRERGMQPGEYVPIILPRSLLMLIAQIAVLKCGGAYVPLDPDTPSQRLAFILKDCRAQRILSDGVLPPDWLPKSVVWIDCDAVDGTVESVTQEPSMKVNALSPAYVMYTSGSTGAPKGVIVSHRAVNRLAVNGGYASIESTDCIAHCSNPAFDASTFEIWGALLNGARVLLVPQAILLDAAQLAKVLIEERSTVLFLTVGLLRAYQETLSQVFGGLRYLITGGEVLDPELARKILRHSNRGFINAYGPTECTTFATTHSIRAIEAHAASIPIGSPISNTTIYILNGRLQPLPLGVVGEVFIGGPGVALGYLNRPELTAERFVLDPFIGDPNATMYKTGDLGRWLADGKIEYIGRNDQQVKIRGFRIELEEVEAQLLRHNAVGEAVVLARQDEPEQKRLVAYVIAKGGTAPSADGLREHLKRALPEYMVPSAFVVLEVFPLTPNGKLDRRALPAPEQSSYIKRDYEAPLGEVEETVAAIWGEILGVRQIGRNDDFFELGGHSLLGIKLVGAINMRLSCSLSISAVFRYPTLAELARAVDTFGPFSGKTFSHGGEAYEEGILQVAPHVSGSACADTTSY
jgi:amino acid adenylation domain-containing protein